MIILFALLLPILHADDRCDEALNALVKVARDQGQTDQIIKMYPDNPMNEMLSRRMDQGLKSVLEITREICGAKR